jgi:nitrite reductase (NO-forming)
MKRNMNYVFGAFIAGSMFLASCGGGTTENTTETKAPEVAEVQEAAPVVVDEAEALGKKIYEEKCIVCHMATGEGLAGAFPSLKGSDLLTNDKVAAVAQALNGSPGGSIIKGVQYNAPMPPQVDTKEEAVAVINYVANNFGNELGTITLDDVKDVVINPR